MSIEIELGGVRAIVDINGWRSDNATILRTLNMVASEKSVYSTNDYVPHVIGAMASVAVNVLGAKIIKERDDSLVKYKSDNMY